VKDLRVSMGGVSPDTGRNVAGLRNAVSFLIESRGVQIGRAHYKRRVATHLTALRAVLEVDRRNADAVLALRRNVQRDTAALAGRGEVVVVGAAKAGEADARVLDPVTGEAKRVEADWRSALDIEAKLKRPRRSRICCRHRQIRAAAQLRQLGLNVLRVGADAAVDAQRYVVTVADEARKDDVRRKDEDNVANVIRLTTALEPHKLRVRAGDFYVPLDQPLANLAVAALEPEPQSSFASNRVLALQPASGSEPQWSSSIACLRRSLHRRRCGTANKALQAEGNAGAPRASVRGKLRGELKLSARLDPGCCRDDDSKALTSFQRTLIQEG
jgi:uncharacterized membrane protein